MLGGPGRTAARSPTRPATSRLQRMANVSLQPAPDGPSTEELISGVERGIYIVGDRSWSIDMQRFNFQFTGQQFHRIENGRLVGQLRDVAYQATTTDFWGSMEAVGGPQTYVLGGAFNCGKGQPGPGRGGVARLPVRAVPRRQRPEHQERGGTVMTQAQELVESGAGGVDGRRLRGHRRRAHRDQPALGGQQPDHQRPDAHPQRHRRLDRRRQRRHARRRRHPVGHERRRARRPRPRVRARRARCRTGRRRGAAGRGLRTRRRLGGRARRDERRGVRAVRPRARRGLRRLAQGRPAAVRLRRAPDDLVLPRHVDRAAAPLRPARRPRRGQRQVARLRPLGLCGQHTSDFADVDVAGARRPSSTSGWTGRPSASTCRPAGTRRSCRRPPSPT